MKWVWQGGSQHCENYLNGQLSTSHVHRAVIENLVMKVTKQNVPFGVMADVANAASRHFILLHQIYLVDKGN